MQRTQIYLSDSEKQGLQALAMSSGLSQSALIREAIDSFLERHQPVGRLARLRQARGLWAASEDLPSWPDLRSELNSEAPAVP
ncbi:MAG: CopG family transcriptional regulator [Synechococcaceae bacterium WBA_2_066]|nr:CopG family transcriptional regulator [Synechococcaceae bacterium WB6_1A_059]NBP32113.1 CopG family transcriptional regulator [Synechococcaceae bacterium WB6_1B_055]NBQ18294.1 CopG family transcriptional regulator [Synechococcaceae bacterium WB5_2A_257]NBR44497.1 CopG family transcriptional regulator [Synechococcaceae bacterium WB5_2B_268]NBS94155.1 CopG family transcriptional regulator [Betaproteobacteria bacterium]NBY60238.1 CopG family transcriptional regulator [Synechococcaceae bacteriu